ncbi:MAG: hypothetical protein QNJ98_02115, partial [Planctomycetota bacterium]|nr:hypothetical protein [Planctomycetota bacterium]
GAAPAAADAPAATRGWTYHVRFEPGFSRAVVAIDFRGYVPKRLVLARNLALAAVRMHPHPSGRAAYRSNPARNGIVPRFEGGSHRVAYTVDLERLAQVTRDERQTKRVGRDLLTRPGLLLLHPARWPDDARVEATFELPPGMTLASAWHVDATRTTAAGRTVYRIPSHAVALHARMAVGRFSPGRVGVPGGEVVYYVLDAPHRATREGIEAWLVRAMDALDELYTPLPVTRTHVLIEPHLPGRGRPVVFGRATRSGGPLVHVMLSGTTTDAEMPGEWITIHELIHLGMPSTVLADRWLGEGFVSYYQEVLRARAGILTPREAWQNLHDWMERGRASGGQASLAEESRRMTMRYAYHRVYWGGAALALKIDVAIRQATRGRRSLDDAMRFFATEYVTPGRPTSGLVLMRLADRHLGVDVCERLARAALGEKRFPDLRRTHADLGIEVRDGRVVLRQDAPFAALRDAIMRKGGR